MQWRIQDFPDGGGATLEFGPKTYYLAKFLPKIAWKWKKLDREQGRSSLASPLIRQCDVIPSKANQCNMGLAPLQGVAVADPGFPRGGGANSPEGRQHTILPNFPENCMKLKEFGPRGGRGARVSRAPLRSATGLAPFPMRNPGSSTSISPTNEIGHTSLNVPETQSSGFVKSPLFGCAGWCSYL